MVVNSLNFLLFFTVVFIIYYLPICRKNAKIRNWWILLASYFFYGVADLKMIPLLLGATVVFYALGLWLKDQMVKGHSKAASRITTLGVVLGVGLLLYFKYLNFFAESFAALLSAIGFNVSWTTLNIVLPVGVSFFTFKLISYMIEVHREHIDPCKNFVQFGAYVAFFPTILSGPIDRPNTFLPQLQGEKQFNYELAVDGCRQILWGMFTKMCIADNLATITDSVWADYSSQASSTLVIVALLYLVQMYADFDGYSNMAIGVGKLLGIKITRNFNHPFLARNIAEYWRNWHMSLTGWLTDYVFSPLNIAFRGMSNLGIILAIIINFVLIGLWHGANWTFALFGLYHGLLYIPLIITGAFAKKKKIKPNDWGMPKLVDFRKMIGTFLLVSLGLILFRAPSLHDAMLYYGNMVSSTLLTVPTISISPFTIIFIAALFLAEWLQRDKEHALQAVARQGVIRWILYFILTVSILIKSGGATQFIYFQF